MHVLITGGTKGIGLEAARLFIDAGWHVTVVARHAADLDLPCDTHDIDLTDIAAIKNLPAMVGDVQVIVNNAGMANPGDFRAYDPQKKAQVIRLNLEAPIEIMTVFADRLQRTGGRIINVGSISGEIGSVDVWYGATKAGLINATKSFAQLLGPNVAVNAIAPGPVDTDLMRLIPPERLEVIKAMAITKRIAKAEEVATLIYWLATDAPRQITGTVIDMNGGAYLR